VVVGGAVVVGAAVVVVVGAAVDVVAGVVVVVVDGTVVVVVAGSVVTGGMAEAGGPDADAGVVVANSGPSVEGAALDVGADDDAAALRSATEEPPPQAASEVATTPAHTNQRHVRFTGGEPTHRSRYLAKTR
jgi:hypothetical protein